MAYGFSRAITINSAQVGGSTLTNFTVLVSGTYNYLAGTSNGGKVTNANGYDIIFTSDAAGQNLLSWEIETYNTTTGAINFWVLIPSVSGSANTVFYMFYGNSAISSFQGGATGAAWDANYLQVWHLPNGSSLSANDSTTNGNNGTITTALATTGQVDGGAIFGGQTTDKITSLLTTSPTQKTYELWTFRTSDGGGSLGRMFEKRTAGVQSEILFDQTAGTRYAYQQVFSTSQGDWEIPIPSPNVWHHLVVTYDAGSVSNVAAIYLDGVAQSVIATQPVGTIVTNTDPYVLGNRGSDNARNWGGSLDEFRISNIVRSAGYVKAAFNNQSSPATFYTVGTPAGGGEVNSMGLNNIGSLNMLGFNTFI